MRCNANVLESGYELDVTRLAALSRFVMDRMRVHPLAELCVKAVDEPTIATLNLQWMEKEGPTDVLAFPMDELRPGLVNEDPEEGMLGDLVLCPAVAERQGEDDVRGVHGLDQPLRMWRSSAVAPTLRRKMATMIPSPTTTSAAATTRTKNTVD